MTHRDHFEQQAERTLEMMGRITRVTPEPHFADSVMRRLAERSGGRRALAPRAYRLAFAALFVLIIVNVFSVVEIGSRSRPAETKPRAALNPVQDLAAEYRLSVDGYQY